MPRRGRAGNCRARQLPLILADTGVKRGDTVQTEQRIADVIFALTYAAARPTGFDVLGL